MQATQLADAVQVFGADELSLEPKPPMPLKVMPAAQSNIVVTPSDLLNIAMQSGDKDVERLERLMGMELRYREQQALEQQRHREWAEEDRIRDGVLAFREDFAKFRGENIIIPLTKHVDRAAAGSFEQAEYHRVAGMLSVPLSKHGYGFRHDPKFGSRKWMDADGVERDIPWVTVTCFLEHRKGHTESVILEGPSSDLKGNTPMQNMQATASFLKRHTLLAVTGTATGGEDDENKLGNRGDNSRTEGGGGTPVASDQLAELLNAGESWAAKGLTQLTVWWGGLSPKERDLIGGEFGKLKKTAQGARA